jgi:fumarate hydratase class II
MLFSIQILANFLPVFTERCVRGITVDEKRCEQYLEKNPSLATLLAPKIGYLEAAKIAKQAQAEKSHGKRSSPRKRNAETRGNREDFQPEKPFK